MAIDRAQGQEKRSNVAATVTGVRLEKKIKNMFSSWTFYYVWRTRVSNPKDLRISKQKTGKQKKKKNALRTLAAVIIVSRTRNKIK